MTFTTIIWRPQPAAPDPLAMAEEAKRNLPLPLPGLRMSPGPDAEHVVNGPATWLWVDDPTWQAQTSTVSAGGVTVVVTAVPVSVVWDMGDGTVVRCGQGTAYDPDRATDCSHVWRRSSAAAPGGRFVVRASATWNATFAVTGVPGLTGGDLGGIDRTSGVGVAVVERHAVNTRPPEQGGR